MTGGVDNWVGRETQPNLTRKKSRESVTNILRWCLASPLRW